MKDPNAEAPKVQIVDLMGALKRSLDQHPNAKPAPAPEPKQGSACPGCGHQTHGSVCMNFGSDNEYPCKAGQQWSERGYPFDDQTAKHKHIGCQTCDEKHIAYLALRAELAQAREEIAKLQRLYAERCNEADNAYIAPGGEPR